MCLQMEEFSSMRWLRSSNMLSPDWFIALTHFGKCTDSFLWPHLELYALVAIKGLVIFQTAFMKATMVHSFLYFSWVERKVHVYIRESLPSRHWWDRPQRALKFQKRNASPGLALPSLFEKKLNPEIEMTWLRSCSPFRACLESRNPHRWTWVLFIHLLTYLLIYFAILHLAEYLACCFYSLSLVGLRSLLKWVEVSGNRVNP